MSGVLLTGHELGFRLGQEVWPSDFLKNHQTLHEIVVRPCLFSLIIYDVLIWRVRVMVPNISLFGSFLSYVDLDALL